MCMCKLSCFKAHVLCVHVWHTQLAPVKQLTASASRCLCTALRLLGCFLTQQACTCAMLSFASQAELWKTVTVLRSWSAS